MDERNKRLVPQLLKIAVGGERAQKLQKSVSVLSREHLIRHKGVDPSLGHGVGNKQKDLTKVPFPGPLSQLVAVDDDPLYYGSGQRRNLLVVPEMCPRHFRWLEWAEQSDSGGEIYHSVNRIYFVAGILFPALRQARASSLPLSSVLFKQLFKPVADGRYSRNQDLEEQDRWYRQGLRELQTVNPLLQFSTTQIYLKAISPPSSASTKVRGPSKGLASKTFRAEEIPVTVSHPVSNGRIKVFNEASTGCSDAILKYLQDPGVSSLFKEQVLELAVFSNSFSAVKEVLDYFSERNGILRALKHYSRPFAPQDSEGIASLLRSSLKGPPAVPSGRFQEMDRKSRS